MMITLGANLRSWQSIAEAARAEASDIGADAVFMGQMGEYQSGSVSLPTGSTTTTTGTLAALRLNSQTFADHCGGDRTQAAEWYGNPV
jgi:hypothetical protein